jgi:chromosome segregation ATPase
LGSVKASVSSLETELGSVKASVSSLETELGAVKASLSSLGFEMTEIKEDAKQRYTDLRSRTELNNDKLSLIMRELNQIAQDIRYPKFTVADTR